MPALAAVLATTLAALGCASRKQVTTAQTPPPPPPATETQTTPPPPPSQRPSQPSEPAESQMSLLDAFFDFDEAALRSDAKTALENNARFLEGHTNAHAIIEGHCD